MNKKILIKALAVIVLLGGVALLVMSVNGISLGNQYYDLFRKIKVNMDDVHAEAQEKGVEQLQTDYTDVFRAVDQIDALGGESSVQILNDVNTAYGWIDTIEATDNAVSVVNTLGTEPARRYMEEAFDAVNRAGEAYDVIKASGSARDTLAYLAEAAEAIELKGPADARESLDELYAESEEELQKKAGAFFDFLFGKIAAEEVPAEAAEAEGKEEVPEFEIQKYLTAAAQVYDEMSNTDFAQQRMEADYAEAPEEDRKFIGIIFRLINAQGADQAQTYLQDILKAMSEKGVTSARDYLNEVYTDTPENHITRKFLDSIFNLADARGMDYVKANCGEVCREVRTEEAEETTAFLKAMNAAEAQQENGTALEKLLAAMNAGDAALKAQQSMIAGKDNFYLAEAYALKESAEKAVSTAAKAKDTLTKTEAELAEANAAAEAARKAAEQASEAEKASLEATAEKARQAADKAATKAKNAAGLAEKRAVSEEAASEYINGIRSALAKAESWTQDAGAEQIRTFQNTVCSAIHQLGLKKEKKYLENAFSAALKDKTLRIDRLGTDNEALINALDGGKVSRMYNKAHLLMGAAALLIIGIALLLIRPSTENEATKLARKEKAKAGQHMGLKTSRTIANTLIHILLVIISVIWLIPFVSILLQSFRVESTYEVGYIMPQKLQFYNYLDLFTETNFPRWYLNTLIMALVTAVLQTVIVLCMSYTLSRFRFKMRKPLMRFMLILGMFPGMLTMIILYRVLKDMNLILANAVPGLILVYIASSGMGYYVSKGFFDTIPKSLDEAARVDGATRFQVLKKIILPLSKPIVIYTVLTAFMGPWGDYVFARYIAKGNQTGMNVAVGLSSWLDKTMITEKYTKFCAGGVLVAIPVAALFLFLQKYYVEGVTGGAVKG